MIATARRLLAQLEKFEAEARTYLLRQGAVSSTEAERLELSGLAAFYPHKDWITHVQRAYTGAVPTVGWEGPMGSLELLLPGDRNVFEVVFSGDTPIASDYH